ncbi:hypothetical protein CAEBREN_19850 [Caenorhabditis brenneri]|uniref:Uncharacterized protein n=1 Tax=Caenorhabditis brenneri TaxID=135651 RepID=G0P2S2_CAEBE|nr:hypothetical protein CAEBREN_19850 [Caenorhabditis brenneri]
MSTSPCTGRREFDDAYEFRNNLMRLDKASKLPSSVTLITDKIDQQKRSNLDSNHVRLPEVDIVMSGLRRQRFFKIM